MTELRAPTLTPYRGRFAPSPTGALHLGLARTALLGWLRARSLGGSFLLRIEDIDGPRVVAGAAEQLQTDLRFLGLDWDEGPDVGGPYGPYVQSARYDMYAATITRLRQAGHIYPCSCSRRDIAIASAPHGANEFGPAYPGTCRTRPVHSDAPLALRFRVPATLPLIPDLCLGELIPSALGDFVVQRADKTVSYQLAVVVDDIAMQVTEVLRGADLAGCTGWQLALYDALGATRPAFAHVPLVLGPDGKRLAKRDRSLAIDQLRTAGVPAERIIGALAASLGLVPAGSELQASDLCATFELEGIAETDVNWEKLLKIPR